ncbi:hypothetical protein EMIHUDRAFT_465321 [Emiliania huxleyi CCMP1516]|uniref:Structural maintenance of chromosomes protein n=5 Tax=Emiliania huxleyi TaxID=2903 RepID=A0A0D3IFG5_EMIH1|nr:hypothetical protein EMIHUDRAFT_465321 [Emiliania huxleyi CCMP1516]EOD10000.1 hypothetical protein EMIHUDRAFT_465321 [Emiliania huxleyi CCMP1516]|eukprot:XP_005762429.1 hypothetical protein EMIHUDRAFT_465321 [Emiliania huxleyi CCMP1516]
MHIVEIVLDGFKSYATRTVITDFDPQFNAITGLNGSGKSNVLDSICFVLGISNLSQVRASNLNELIYKQGQAGVTKASVTLVFDNSNRELSPHGYDHYSKITVTRQVAIGGRNKYLINGQNAQLQRVQNLFHSVGLNVNNPHFLIMQGRITKVLNMKPVETLGMIEEAAGTRMFELKKQQSIKIMEKKETKLDEIKRLINDDIAPRLDKLGSERAQYLEYSTLSSQNESLVQKKVEEEQAGDFARQRELQQTLSDAKAEDASLSKDAAEVAKAKKSGASDAVKALEKKEDEASKDLVKATASLKQRRDAIAGHASAADGHANSIKELEAAKARAAPRRTAPRRTAPDPRPARTGSRPAGEHAKALEAATAAEAAHGAVAGKVKSRREQYEADIGMGASASGEGVKNLQGQLSDATAEVKAQETALKQSEMRGKTFSKEAKEVEKQLAAASKSGDKALKEQDSLQNAVAAAQAKVGELGFDEAAEAALTGAHAAAQKKRDALAKQADAAAAAIGGGADFRFRDPEPGFDRSRVKGTIASSLRVQDMANATALEALAGGRLHQVVVDNEKTGMLLLTKGGLQRRVTLIPLNKIKATTASPAQLQQVHKLVGDRAVAAVSLISCAAELQPARRAVGCPPRRRTPPCGAWESARLVCEKLRLKTVTLDGDLYDPQGTVTGGSRPKGNACLLVKIAGLQAGREQLAAADAELKAASAALDEWRKQAEAHKLAMHQKTLQAGEAHVLSTRREELRSQLAEAEAAGVAAREALSAAKELRESLAARLTDFEGNRDERLKQSKAAIASAEKEAKASAKALEKAQQAEQKLRLQLQSLVDQTGAAEEALAETRKRSAEGEAELVEIEARVTAAKAAFDEATGGLKSHKEAQQAHEARLAQIGERREALEQEVADAEVELKQLEHRCSRAIKEKEAAEAMCRDLLSKNPWMEPERSSFGQPGGEYDFKSAKHVAAQQKALAKQSSQLEALSKRINKKVLSMFEKAQAEYSDLMGKKATVEKDKAKIEAVIAECDVKKIEALQKTWAKVNADFGSIFSTLLPGTDAKLEPEEGKAVEDGLCVKVAFGKVWKQSLLELSGGQRSLVALSLVLALLRFKPAPVYILDEIDAALDLSHTQNIGAMIKSHFQQSQFLVVSLKEGMFNNANVLFRTKFVDGVSTITRTVPSGADRAAAGAAGGKKPAGASAASRKALTAVN